MRKGKLQQSVLVRSVFKMLGQKREDAAGPAGALQFLIAHC